MSADALERLRARPVRVVAGLMSGTSADGVDAAVVRLAGSGRGLELEPLAFVHHPYEAPLRDALLRNAEAGTSDVRELALLDALLARRFAAAAREAAAVAGAELDLIGSHGHTFHHVPEPVPVAGEPVSATLQLGRPAALAVLADVPVVADFRAADVALGGQGAPLVPYVDWACFADDTETRLLLNLGGIANLTVLPAGGAREAVYAFDTGPANMLLDALARDLLGAPFDRDGAAAACGTPDEALLARLLADPFFERPPPKSTGRERYGTAAVRTLLEAGGAPEDLLATATALTARSIALAVERFVRPHHPPDVVIVSGGGCRNRTLLAALAEALAPTPVREVAAYGMDPDAKEALCFAVLAHEWVNGVATGMPGVTGAARAARLGVLALP